MTINVDPAANEDDPVINETIIATVTFTGEHTRYCGCYDPDLLASIDLTADYSDNPQRYDIKVSVTDDATASAIFKGSHIRSWSHRTLPDAVKDIELRYDANPDRCEVVVTASSNASDFAYNVVGESTSAILKVKIAADSEKIPDSAIDKSESMSMVPGGTATVIFVGHLAKFPSLDRRN